MTAETFPVWLEIVIICVVTTAMYIFVGPEPLPAPTEDTIPDDTACTPDEWNAKVDALLESCMMIEQENIE